ncbi:hypothetical protein CR513_61210, partial [Mucuna pruriens]
MLEVLGLYFVEGGNHHSRLVPRKNMSSFHLLVGEVIIDLDYVSFRLHLPIVRRLCSYSTLQHEEANTYLMYLIEVTFNQTYIETNQLTSRFLRCTHLVGNIILVSKAFLLHLVGCNIFIDKSSTCVDVAYLRLFCDLDKCID